MSWLRTDDSFTSHPKFEGWPPAHKWAFLELMHYCARYRTDGRIPNDLNLLPRSTTRQSLNRAEASGWIDHRDGALWIHDFPLYNPRDVTAADRNARHRKKRDVDRNASVTEGVTETVTDTAPHARAHAEPVPSPNTKPRVVSASPLSAHAKRPQHRDLPKIPDILGDIEP